MYKLLISLFLLLLSINTHAKVVVIGGYVFPPYVYVNKDNASYNGLCIDLIELLNSIQEEHKFKFYPTTARRRYLDFKENNFQMMLFESTDWGWEKESKVHFTKFHLEDSEVFITLKSKTKNQKFFEGLKNKRIGGYLGYHYAFADFNSNSKFLKDNFNFIPSTSHEKNIERVLKSRIDLAIVTLSYLNMYLSEYKEIENKLLISKKKDQIYKHNILYNPDILTKKEIDNLITKLRKSKKYKLLLKKYGLDDSIVKKIVFNYNS